MRRAWVLALLAGLAAGVGGSACLGPLPVDQYTYTCRADGDCAGGNLCVAGVCKPAGGACTSSADCAATHCCDTFTGVDTCVAPGQECSFGTCNGQTRSCE